MAVGVLVAVGASPTVPISLVLLLLLSRPLVTASDLHDRVLFLVGGYWCRSRAVVCGLFLSFALPGCHCPNQ